MIQEALADGRYVLDGVVGVGGMAEVHRARDTRLGRDVAVKLFRPGTADGVSRGSAEARLLAGLHHPGLVRVLDMDSSGTSSGPTYLVMELVEGPDLGAMLARGPLSPEAVRLAGWDIARTLGYIHQRGILHRDIKPSNILTCDAEPGSGVFGYLLTDFGIARFYDGSRMTATGQTIGTAAYLSPEQARGGAVDTPTDIYSLGLVLLECLTGARAFPGTSLESALARLHRAPSIPEALGPAWQSLLARMMADNPGDRPSAGAVADAFAQWDDAVARPSPSPSETPRIAGPLSAATRSEGLETRPAYRLSLPEEPAMHPASTEASVVAAAATAVQPGSARSHPADSSPDRAQDRRRPRRSWLIGVFAVIALLILSVLVIVILNPGGAADPGPLPSVPGTTGELLQELYERVGP